MKTKVLITCIVCLILVSFSMNVFSTNEALNIENDANQLTNMTLQEQKQEVEDKITESNTRLEYVQNELTASLNKIQELSQTIEDYQIQYDDLARQVETLEIEVAQTNNNLIEIQEQYDKKEKVLKKRIVTLYEAGSTTYLDVLLSSRSLSEFLSNYYLIQEIMEADSSLLKELENKKKKLEQEKLKQEEQSTQLKTAKSEISNMQILLENNKILQENYLINLTEEEKKLQEQIEEYKAEQEELEQKIRESMEWGGVIAIQFTGGAMIWPVAVQGTYITSGYGVRLHPIQGVYKGHDGIDIGNAGYGAPVVAAADGVVTFAGVLSGYGNCVIISHGVGIVTLYGHGQDIIIQMGSQVKQGDVIMTVGSTGNSTGPHLHFEVRKDGSSVDPLPYLQASEEEKNVTNEDVTEGKRN